jgi:DNA-binding NarL/FixJ family response regulator
MPDSITRVLLVDDHSLVRCAFRRMLKGEPDLSVIGEASDGHEAVEAAQRLRPDVVVMDFALPNMNGGLATRHILELLPHTAVLILSMHSSPSYVRSSMDAGARGYLLKSAVDLELAEAVREIAAGRQVLDPQVMLPAPPSNHAQRLLTPRELEVLQLIVRGKSSKEIADVLGISANTAAVHRANIMQALAVHNTAKLVLYAVREGLVDTP